MPRTGPQKMQQTKTPLKIKEALHKGELLSDVRLEGNKVALKLKSKFNQPEKYASINKCFFDLYLRSDAFKRKFERPMRGERMLYALTLKDGHGYNHSQQILAALRAFAAPIPRRDLKKDLSTGALLADVILEDKRVTLVMRQNYTHPDNYVLINKLFYRMHRGIRDFSAKFEPPTQGAHPPVLFLKEGHGYEDKTTILAVLQEFAKLEGAITNTKVATPNVASSRNFQAASQENAGLQIDYQFVEAFKTGSLFMPALTNHAGLHIAPHYNLPFYYQSIEGMLNRFCRNSPELSAQIEDFKIVEGIVQIRTRPQSTHPNVAAVLTALMNQANNIYPQSEIFLPEKAAMPEHSNELARAHLALLPFNSNEQNAEPLRVREAVHQGDLLSSISYPQKEIPPQKAAMPEHSNEFVGTHSAPLISNMVVAGKPNPTNMNSLLTSFRLSSSTPKRKKSNPEKGPNSKKAKSINPNEQNAKPFLKVKEALRQGELLSSITRDGNCIHLKLKSTYDKQENYATIRRAFYDLYFRSTTFRAKFEKPSRCSSSLISLTLKNEHGYRDDREIIEALQGFAAPSESIKFKEKLWLGELFIGATLNGNQVLLTLHEQYNNPDTYALIRKMLYNLYDLAAFAEKFELPAQNSQSPTLTLKNNHGYEDGKAILEALKSFAEPAKPLEVQKALTEGKLLAGATLNGNHIELTLQDAYNKPENYRIINQSFYQLYRRAARKGKEFQAKFEQPAASSEPPQLILKPDHGYKNKAEIFAALKGIFKSPIDVEEISSNEEMPQVVSDGSSKNTDPHHQEAPNINNAPQRAMVEGKLLAGVILQDKEAILQLQEEYNQPQYYSSINDFFCNLHKKSQTFQSKFKRPHRSRTGVQNLVLQDNHGFTDGPAVLKALRSYANAKTPLKVREALHEGKLLSSITCDGNSVHLKLKSKYDKPKNYASISKAFADLYSRSTNFKAKFEKPKRCTVSLLSLTLKSDHGYKNNREIMQALRDFTAPSKPMGFKEKLQQGKLVARAILNGNQVSLTLHEEYNNPDYYLLIRKMLYKLHHSSTAFAGMFVLPLQNEEPPALTLKDNHGYKNGKAILKALKKIAATKSVKPHTDADKVSSNEGMPQIDSPSVVCDMSLSSNQNQLNAEQQSTEEMNYEKERYTVTKKVSPNGHIAEKYLGGALPQLPEPSYGQITQRLYNHQLTLIALNSPNLHRTNRQRQSYTINCPEISAFFYSHRSLPGSHEQIAFICAGRKEKALLPEVYTARCILVLTQQEYAVLKDLIPQATDVLVLERINSNTHGEYTDLSKLTARRIGIFLMAHHWNLNHFVMMDDNIKGFNFQIDEDATSNNTSHLFEKFYTLLNSQLKNQGCVSVATESNRINTQGQLGSKCFLINMQLIRQQLTTLESVFLLQPPAHEVNKSCEDYYFQILLYVMLERGYQVIPRDITTLQRSRKEQNACVNSQIRAEKFTGPRFSLPPQQQCWLEQTLKMLNHLIEKNINDYQEKQTQIKTMDIGPTHIRAHEASVHSFTDSSNSCPLVSKKKKHKTKNKQRTSVVSNANRSITPQVTAADTQIPVFSSEGVQTHFIDRFQTFLSTWQDDTGLLYDYQVNAIKAISQQKSSFSCLEIPTGCGKSIIQYRLASLAFSLLEKEELVIVVSPQIQLTHQLYQSFLEGYKIFNEREFDSAKIITVSSDNQSCSLKLLAKNKNFHKEKYIVIICLESFERFHELFPEQMRRRVRLVLLDECHDYPSTVDKLPTLGLQDTLVVGCSATLLPNTALGKPIFTYPIAQAIQEGRLAPVIVDSLGVNYSKENVKKLIQCLPLILQHQPHPGFKETETLASTKTMVFLPKRSHCNKAYDILSKADIPCFIIHSDNEECKADLKRFVQQARYGVVLCVRMLSYGFNDLNIGTVIIAQNKTKAKKQKHVNSLRQMFGRAIRKKDDKIAYVLTFDNTKKKIIDPLLAGIPHTYPASSDYLGVNNAYCFDQQTQTWKVDDAEEIQDLSQIVFKIEASHDYEKRRSGQNDVLIPSNTKNYADDSELSDSDVDSETSDSDDEIFTLSQPLIFSQRFLGFIPQRAMELSEESSIEAIKKPMSHKVRITR